MKKAIYFLSTLIMLGSLSSCKKEVAGTAQQIVIEAEIASGALYQLDLSAYGSNAAITKQATSFTTSKISSTSRTSAGTYQYTSAAKTATTDQVVLAVTDGKTGSRNCGPSDSTIVTINFNVK